MNAASHLQTPIRASLGTCVVTTLIWDLVLSRTEASWAFSLRGWSRLRVTRSPELRMWDHGHV